LAQLDYLTATAAATAQRSTYLNNEATNDTKEAVLVVVLGLDQLVESISAQGCPVSKDLYRCQSAKAQACSLARKHAMRELDLDLERDEPTDPKDAIACFHCRVELDDVVVGSFCGAVSYVCVSLHDQYTCVCACSRRGQWPATYTESVIATTTTNVAAMRLANDRCAVMLLLMAGEQQ